MIKRIVNKLHRFFSNHRKKLLLRALNRKNVFIGTTNNFDSDVLFDTSAGGKITIGSGNQILRGCLFMTYGGSIEIGNNCSINPYSIIYGHGKGVKIGDNVLIAGHCMIIPANHIFENTSIPIKNQGLTSKGIIIEDDVWLGGGCKILDGVVIGKGAVIAAGSVVTKSVKENTIVAGVPARVIKTRM
jgi:acetyltransferase-like isoleucine patch superfamily enzyme